MSTHPSIIVTRLDVQRLERLIDSLDEKTQDSPGVLALQDELDRADQVGHEEVPAGVVTMNSRVHCREEASGKDYHLTLVYPKDANADEGKISILAPIGSALLGLSVGEQIDWPAPGGKTLKLKLLEVEYQPEAAGDFDL
ncbi:nucleoside diphosphate kinase regulator [Pseudomonas sp. NPDC087612]|uniref:nucleoside diphosphate kinase regulator n=1 Tax=Pseudomonas TaxID=286 RepID=UPI0005EB9E97|nr:MULTISPECIES: nucleoside diphosphate kinase regulator [unclassified Pseudomonas]KJK15175.1 nucleoside diphosphate kinase regulator [Pseudomonas sp. 2(2015)]QVM96906.1 nucleoside diphosphate kinase regulator [Pseudomonas sp. SORT22]UVL61525.1 nucleoside diphosphate kinase regulator [Pseudomonas sp. B21-032]UVM55837.1 nucleoside diphosphate kinase regulator [Pseudomonas sp. B21-012]